MKVIRDALWGDIELTDDEVAILDTREMQRLRRVRQLGAAYLVYPSAVHTRFEHAIGTLGVAARILARLALPAEDARVVRLIALVHDATHVPFGHTMEDERGLLPRHDRPERVEAYLGAGELGDALRRTGLAERVIDGACDRASPPYVADLVCGTAGADLLDYVARDAYFAGLGPSWDERVLRYVAVAQDGHAVYRVAKNGVVRPDAISEVIHLLRLRYRLMERVYLHHAKVSAGALVARAVEEALREGFTLDDLYAAGDETLIATLPGRFPRRPVIGRLLDRFARRRLPRRAATFGPEIPEERRRSLAAAVRGADRAAVEDDLARAAGLDPGDVLLVCPPPDVHAKPADVRVDTGTGVPRPLESLGLPEVEALVAGYRNLWRLGVLVPRDGLDRAAAVAALVRERLGL